MLEQIRKMKTDFISLEYVQIDDHSIDSMQFMRRSDDMKEKKPITEYEEIYGLGDMVSGVPLCPHCGEWSYYTTKEAEENGGYTECPFCGGLMYMPD